MSPIGSAPANHSEIERLCRRGEFQQALDFAAMVLRGDPLDRATRLYDLLIRIVLNGPDGCEVEIENLRTYTDLTDWEKNLIRKILVVCHDVAERQQDLGKMWSYQRLLRRLVLNQSMDTPVPGSDDMDAPSSTVTAVKGSVSLESFFRTESAAGLRKRIFEYMDKRVGARPGQLVFALALITSLVAVYTMHGSYSQTPSIEEAQPVATPAPLPIAAMRSVDASVSEFSAKAKAIDLDGASIGKLRGFIDGKLLGLKALYAARSLEASGLAGDMTVELIIDGFGNVTRIYENGASLIDLGFKQTVLDEMRKWRFPGLNREEVSIGIIYRFAAKAAPPPQPSAAAQSAAFPEPNRAAKK